MRWCDSAFVLAAVLVGSIFRYPLVTDDPYITYRYARNLAQGAGFVFNAGERVLSTTTPLYAIVLALFGLLRVDIPAMGYWLSVVSYGIAAFWLCVLAGLAFRGAAKGASRAGIASSHKPFLAMTSTGAFAGITAGVLLLVSPALVMTFGLETGFYLMLGLAALTAYLLERVTLAFALCALLTLTRNDGLVLTGILALDYLWQQRTALRDMRYASESQVIRRDTRFLRPFLVYLFTLFPWLLFSTFYFGSPFPFTLAAKIAQQQSGLWDAFAVGFFKWARDNLLWLAPLSVFALLGIVWAVREKSRLLLLLAWAILHLTAYSILGVAFYPWYVAPLIPALCLFAGLGVAQFAETRILAQNRFVKCGVIVLCAVVLVGLELRATFDAGMTRPSPKVEAYQRAAQWLAQNTDANASVDALEVGVIGYFDNRRTLDFVGLVDPQRVPYLCAREFADGVRRAHAEYVIAIPPDEWLPEDVWFKDAYRAVQEIRVNGFYGGRPLVIYERADAGRAPVETREVNAAFEKRIQLERVDVFARTVQRGDRLPLRLHLRALDAEPIPDAWKFTVQLVGAENRVAAQTDNFYPARLPEDGKPFADYQAIPIPPNAPPGEYDLILAMYDAQANERLSFYDANGNEAGDFINLGRVSVTSNQ